MDAYAQVSASLATAITDLTAGGELQLLEEVLSLKEELNERVSASERELALNVREKLEDLESIAPVHVKEPEIKEDAVSLLSERADQLISQREQLQAQSTSLKQQLTSMTEDLQRERISSQNERERLEHLCKLFHEITGVFWEDERTGYVLSEEIAKPIKFQECKEATEQLWEMIDM